MKKPSQKTKRKKRSQKKGSTAKNTQAVSQKQTAEAAGNESMSEAVKPAPAAPKAAKVPEKTKAVQGNAVTRVAQSARQFLIEAKTELKKVKWPTRKELFASTAVVIVLTLLVAFFLGLVDFGLVKIIKNLVD